MIVDDRQRARDRAADGVAPRESVVVAAEMWPRALKFGPDVSAARRRQFYRDRARTRAATS